MKEPRQHTGARRPSEGPFLQTRSNLHCSRRIVQRQESGFDGRLHGASFRRVLRDLSRGPETGLGAAVVNHARSRITRRYWVPPPPLAVKVEAPDTVKPPASGDIHAMTPPGLIVPTHTPDTLEVRITSAFVDGL